MNEVKTKGLRWLLVVFSLALFGCLQPTTPEAKAAFGIFFLTILVLLVVSIIAFANIMSWGIIRKPASTIGALAAALVAGLVLGNPWLGGVIGVIVLGVLALVVREKALSGALKTVFAWVARVVAVVSVLATVLLELAVLQNFFQCPGGCANVAAPTLALVLVSLAPAGLAYITLTWGTKNT